MPSPTANYAQAGKELQAACNAVDRMLKIIDEGSRRLSSSWATLVVQNATDVTFPPDVISKSSNRNYRDDSERWPLDVNTWPSGQKIAELLSKYHECKANLQRAFQLVPEDERGGLQPPIHFDRAVT